MDVLQGKANLSKPIEYLGFREMLTLSFELIYFFLKITSISIFHHDAKFAFLSTIDFFEENYVGVLELLQKFSLTISFPPLLF
jgi:hypothetical protein